MSKFKAALFDADGVLALPQEFFSQMYARSHGFDVAEFEQFFKNQFSAARVGKTDLKELISKNRDLWRWEGDVDGLLEQWFESENVRNEPLLDVIRRARNDGTACYLATNQEKYRGEYIKNNMFKDEFDGYFISSFMGVEKPDDRYFEQVILDLQEKQKGLALSDIVYFDDNSGHVESARKQGLQAYVYESVDQVSRILF